MTALVRFKFPNLTDREGGELVVQYLERRLSGKEEGKTFAAPKSSLAYPRIPCSS